MIRRTLFFFSLLVATVPAATAAAEPLDLNDIQDVVLSMEYDVEQ